MAKEPLTKCVKVGAWVLDKLSQATEGHLLSPVFAPYKNMVHMNGFTGIGWLL